MIRVAPNALAWTLAALLCFVISPLTRGAEDADDAEATAEQGAPAVNPKTGKRIIPNKRCLKCHGDEEEQTEERDDGTIVNIYIHPEQLEASVHGKQLCVSCHTNVTKVPHKEPPGIAVGCVECHQETWAEDQASQDPKHERLGVVIQQIES